MYLLVVWILFFNPIQGQTWDNQYDEIAESGYSVSKICEVDNGYIYGNIGIGSKINLFKVEKETGEIIWHKEHRITGYTWPAKILPMAGKRLLIIGCTYYEQFLLITDSLGNEMKKKVWRTDGYYISGLRKIVQNNDSTYTALGFLVNESGSNYFSLVKFDKNLEIIWEKSYSVEIGDIYAESIIKDGENYIAFGPLRGSLNALNPGLMKFDKNGNILWKKKYPEYSFAAGLSDLINLSNGYLISSLSRHNGNAGPDCAALMKIDKNGNIVWFKDSILDFLDFGLMIKVWEINNEYVGIVRAQPAPYPETYIVKTDTFGNIIAYEKWNRVCVFDAILTQDQHLLVGGGNSYSEKPWAFKTSIPETSDLLNENPVTTIQSAKLMQNYPNPFNSATTIEFQIPKKTFVQIIIYDITGQKIKTLFQKIKEPGIYSLIWNGKDNYGNSVSSGVYICQLITNQKKVCKKLIFQK